MWHVLAAKLAAWGWLGMNENELFSKNTDWIKDFYLITLEIHDWMMPKQSPSKNFFREHSKENRDCYLKGDMVFSIKN